LGLTQEITLTNNRWIRYFYDGSGGKYKKVIHQDGIPDLEIHYQGDLIYHKKGSLPLEIYSLSNDEGRVLYLNNDWVYEYQYKDHLGNLRVAFREKAGVAVAVQINSFDPWGNSLVGINQEQGDTTDTFLYQGYEREYAFGLNLDDAVARFYDPQIGRMHGIDAVDHHGMSGYAAMGNNPVSIVDPDGRNPIAIGFMIGMFASSISHAINGTMPSGIGDFIRPGIQGAIGGGISAGIGTAFGQLGDFTGKGLLQAGVHAFSGGVQSAAWGGDFWQGAVSSGISSGAASLASAAGLGGIGTILAGGLSGGISANLFGGDFWDGARDGLIVATLNHFAHGIPESVARTAEKYVGSSAWAKDVEKDNFGVGDWKCNKFCYDVLDENNVAPLMQREILLSDGIWWKSRAYTAGEWADPNIEIKNWKIVGEPKRGDVAAYKAPYSDATGHVGIVTGGGRGVWANNYTIRQDFINNKVWDTQQTIIYRRYVKK
jgi:RHS repeat-associated protein